MHCSGPKQCIILPCIAARITCVARAIRHLVCLPPGSTLHAKKSMKVKGVTDRSRQLSAVRTMSSIRPTVPGSKSYLLVPSTCNAIMQCNAKSTNVHQP